MGLVFTAKDLASPTMRRMRGGLDSLSGTSEAAAARMTSAFKTIGLGAGIAAAGFVGLAILNRTTVAAEEFGTAIAEVSTLVDEATFSTAEMEKITRTLALQFGGKAPEQARALYQIISAGASNAEEATALLTQTNKLALGGVTDLTTAANGLTTAMSVYAASGLTAEEASDAMFTAMRLGKTTIGELSEAMGRVLPTANALGISFDEMLAAISAVTLGGLKTREAVTGLKAALAGVQKPTADARKEAARLGITFDAATLRAKGLNKFMLEIMESSGFTEDSFTKLFGSIEGLNAIIALATNKGSKFNEILAEMGMKAGATDTAVKKMSETLRIARERFARAREDIGLTVGQAIEPFKIAILDLGTRIFKMFTALPEPVKNFGVILLGLASSAAVLTGGLVVLAGVFKLLGIVSLAAFLPFLIIAAKIIIVIGALVAVALVLRKVWESNFLGIRDIVAGFVESLRELWGFIVGLLRPEWEKFMAAFALARERIGGILRMFGLLGNSTETTGGGFKILGKIIFNVFFGIIRIVTAFVAAFLWVATTLIKILSPVVELFAILFGYATGAVGAIGKFLGIGGGGGAPTPGPVTPTVPVRPTTAAPEAPGAAPVPGGIAGLGELFAARAPEAPAPTRAEVQEMHTHVYIDGELVVKSVERKLRDDARRSGELAPQFGR